MTPNELHRVLQDAWREGTLALPAAALAGSPAAAAAAGHWRDGVLTLAGAPAPELHGDRVVVAGGAPAGLTSFAGPCTASAEWWIGAGGTAELRVRLVPTEQDAEGTALMRLFPALAPSFTGAYRFREVALVIDSTAPPVDFDALQERCAPGLFHRPAGARVSGTLELRGGFVWPALLEPVRALLGASADAAGALRLVNGVPQYVLHVPGTAVKLGHLELDTGLDVIGLFLDPDDDPAAATPPEVDGMHRLAAALRLPDRERTVPLETYWQVALPGTLEVASGEIRDVPGALRELGKSLLDIPVPDWSGVPGLPWLDTFNLTELRVAFDARRLRLSSVSTTFTLLDPAHPFVLIPELLKLDGIRVQLAAQDGELYAALTGALAVRDTSVDGPFEVGITLPDCSFRVGLGPASTLDAAGLLRRLVPQLPAASELKIGELELAGSRAEESLTFAAGFEPGTSIDFHLFRLEEVNLYFAYSRRDGVSRPSLELSGALRITDQLAVHVSGRVSGEGWLLEGSLDADPPLKLEQLLPPDVKLPAELAGWEFRSVGATVGTAGGKRVELHLEGRVGVDFGDAGSVWGTGVRLAYESADDGYRWSVEAEGGLRLVRVEGGEHPWFVDCPGKLRVEGDRAGFGIRFDSAGCAFDHIPLLIPARVDAAGVQWSELSFRLATVELGKDEDGWHFHSGFKLRVTRTFPQLMHVLPEGGVEVELRVEKGVAAIHLKDPFLTITVPDFALPAVGEMPAFAMGESRVRLGPLKLLLGRREVGVECDLAFQLPQRTNYLLGTDPATGRPRVELLDTFDPAAPDRARAVRVSFFGRYRAGAGGGLDLGGRISELPLKALERDGDHYLLNLGPAKDGLGEYGSLRFAMPEMKVDLQKGGVSLDADVELKKDFAIPLDLLKRMLGAGSMKGWADELPDALPVPYLDRPSLFAGNRLDVEGVRGYFRKLTGRELPQAGVDALKRVAEVADRLPDALKKYLELPRPSGMKLRLVVRPDASVDVTLAATPDVKLLMVSPTGSLQGITLRSFSFGELFGGQLFSLRVDADFEQFDAAQLGVALLAPESSHPFLGQPLRYGTRLELHKLFILIIPQTAIPIPVPLFYDRLGVSYYGIGDFAFQGGISFPEPSLDLVEIGTLLGDLIRFVTKEEFRLDPHRAYERFNLRFGITPTFLTAPGVMGGARYGLTEGWTPPSAYETFARVANGIKFLELRDLISILPLDARFHAGSEATRVRFAGIDAEMEWLVTTPAEFLERAREKMGLAPDAARQWLSIVPGPNDTVLDPAYDGLLAYLRGDWSTAYGHLALVFGLVSASVDRARMGVRITGRVGGLFSMDAVAWSRVGPDAPYFALYGSGRTRLDLGALPVFSGETTLQGSGTDFNLAGRFSILDAGSIVYLGGDYAGAFDARRFALSGALTARFLVFELAGQGKIGSDGIEATLALGGLSPTTLAIGERGNGVFVSGSLNLGWTTFSVETTVEPTESVPALGVTLGSSSIANLLALSLSFRASAGTLQAQGSLGLDLAGTRVLSGWARVDGGSLAAGGEFSLWLAPGVGVEAQVSGYIGSQGFQLDGRGRLQVLLPPVDCSVTIGTGGVGGGVWLLGVEYSFRIGSCNGSVIFILRGFNTTSYIDHDGLHVNKNPPCSFEGLMTPGLATGPNRLSAAPALLRDALELALSSHGAANGALPAHWVEIGRSDAGAHPLWVEARHDGRLALRVSAAASGHGAASFFAELNRESQALLARLGRPPAAPLDLRGATATLETVPAGEKTVSWLTLHFPAERERRRRLIRYRFPGLFPTYSLYRRVAASL